MTMLHKTLLVYKRNLTFISRLRDRFKFDLIYNNCLCYLSCSISWLLIIRRASNRSYNQVTNNDTNKSMGCQGFTLVELLVTVSVLAIIATIAAPALQTQLAGMEAKRVESQLRGSLTRAKAESYIRRQNVLLCLSNDGGRCHRDSDKTLLLFIDKNNNNHFDNTVDQLITQQSLNLRYSKLSLRVGSRRHYTKFWGDSGKPRGHFGHIKYCPTVTYNKSKYLVSFNQTGIIKQKLDENHPTQCDS